MLHDSYVPLSRDTVCNLETSTPRTLEHSLSNRITTVLSKCLNLHTLELITPHAHLSALFVHAHFPNLRTFQHALVPDVPTDLSAFLNRHQTTTSLELMAAGFDGNFHLAPIQLHNLTAFSGDSLFLRSLVCDNTLDLISIFFFDHDFEAALERLGPMTCSEELGKLKYLRILEIGDFDEEPHDMTETFRVVDQHTVEKWSETCPSLTSIVLHGQYWERVGTEWEATSCESPC
ncbi:hypothetical protein B0H13DRAFT_2332672 [Mycena leptocephala]|nr:hypothetical protein B0H13DRAFT_2332672 [Mycena leptocephala]